jgi:hypothetical protein
LSAAAGGRAVAGSLYAVTQRTKGKKKRIVEHIFEFFMGLPLSQKEPQGEDDFVDMSGRFVWC